MHILPGIKSVNNTFQPILRDRSVSVTAVAFQMPSLPPDTRPPRMSTICSAYLTLPETTALPCPYHVSTSKLLSMVFKTPAPSLPRPPAQPHPCNSTSRTLASLQPWPSNRHAMPILIPAVPTAWQALLQNARRSRPQPSTLLCGLSSLSQGEWQSPLPLVLRH